MPTSARPGRSRWNDTIRCHLTLWATLIVLAGVADVVHPSASFVGGSAFGQALVGAGNAWLLGTLPVLLAGGLAVATALRRTRLLVATGLVLGSTVVEVVGYAAWSAFSPSTVTWWREAIYAVSAVLLAAAWLTARAWGRPGLLASPIAGLASWFAVPHLTAALYGEFESRFIGLTAGYAVEVLVLSVPAVVLIVLRWTRTVQSAQAAGKGSPGARAAAGATVTVRDRD